MIKASIALALIGLGVLAASLSGALEVPFYLPLSTLALAGILVIGRDIPKFLRIFLVMLAATHVVLVLLILGAVLGAITGDYTGYVPPPSAALGATAFGALIYGLSHVRVIQTVCRITDRYLDSQADSVIRIPFIGLVRAREGTIGTWMIAVLIAINLAQVALNVRLSFFSRDMFNALEAKDAAAFWYQLFVIFTPLAGVFVAIALTEVLLQNVLTIRWRAFLNTYYVGEWLDNGAHYRMQLMGRGADNPDQRISEDLRKFVESTYSLSIGLMNQAATLVSFVAILWTISAGFTFPGTSYEVPGLLVWVCAGYAILGTWVTHLIGRPLIPLNFEQERVEANYRFSLARLREYTEQVALLSGETAEKEGLSRRFGQIVDNYMRIVVRLIKLNSFTAAYFQANVVVPYILTAPYYFIGKITLGQMQQVVGAFSRVESALTYFIQIYTTLADYKAVLDRLTTFEGAIASAQRVGGESKLAITQSASRELRLKNLNVGLPDGRTLMHADGLAFRPGERTLMTGPSGSGKSTLFRAIAGIWPFGEGEVLVPQGQSMMLLPQRPYIPIGTLREAVAYPSHGDTYSDAELAAALRAAKLPQIADRLDEERAWGQTLSLGEQQRLAVARALLAKPDWLFLDEATAALDEPTEAEIYEVIKRELPQTTVVSIGHRSTLIGYHDRRIDLKRAENGLSTPVDMMQPQPAE
ncbi:ABC transporter ATP-binding protein/permease [Microvirga guangxiensis]|uniref:Putative ATP-binding cassette transporter n=1 Tax=Microvirga guangxiensis TaxID=549386 RepID=A0A1G5JFX9_9HYPH|nr:ABC transporter ATP-binding protein/permease [Microvirga guangxiensis]SCY87266.1 putative ATP-binding cassette transporter [Microvirga guangxiensis]